MLTISVDFYWYQDNEDYVHPHPPPVPVTISRVGQAGPKLFRYRVIGPYDKVESYLLTETTKFFVDDFLTKARVIDVGVPDSYY